MEIEFTMNHKKNLMGPEAVEKLRSLLNDTPTCMFGSGMESVPFHVCPMQVQEVDDEGNLWFFSGADSIHNRQLANDSRAHLIFANNSKVEYVTVFGETTISRDRTVIDRLWSKMTEVWFPGGPSDPNVTLLSVRPIFAHYWDTENGKLVTMGKILAAAISGTTPDVGAVDGTIKV